MNPFKPTGPTVNIVTGVASGNVLIEGDSTIWRKIRVMNNASSTVWIKFGTDNTVAATVAADIPIGSGGTEVFTVHSTPIYIAAIVASGTPGNVYATPGEGF
jgi:hypothetical protein